MITVGSILTPRSEVVFIDIQQSFERNRGILAESAHSILPVCDGGPDHVIGVARATDILRVVLEGGAVDFAAVAQPALFVPQSISLMKLLEHFKRTHLTVALVIDEFGDVAGLVSLTDVVSAIVGELPIEPGEEPTIVQREDGTWLVDGSEDVGTVGRAVGWDPPEDANTSGTARLADSRCSRSGACRRPATCSAATAIASKSWTWTATALTACSWAAKRRRPNRRKSEVRS